MLNVHSAVTLEYNYNVDLIILWKNRKETVISMQKVRRMMYFNIKKRLDWIYA